MNLDPRSMIAMAGFMSAIMAIVLLFMRRYYPPSIRGVGAWAAAPLLWLVSTVLFGARGLIPDWLSLVLANQLLVLGTVNLLTAVGFIALLPTSRNFTPRPPQGLRHHLRLWGGHLRQPGLPRLFLMSFTVMGCFVTVYNYVGFHLMEAPYGLSQTQIGIIFMANIFGIVSSSIAGGLADRHGRGPVLIVGIACMVDDMTCGSANSAIDSWA